MPNKKELLTCRVCGLIQADYPWGEDGISPTYDICPCCGVEFGYEDSTSASVKKYRQGWLEKGANWFDKKKKPANWRLEEQIINIPKGFMDDDSGTDGRTK
jgi:hypothetical protein